MSSSSLSSVDSFPEMDIETGDIETTESVNSSEMDVTSAEAGEASHLTRFAQELCQFDITPWGTDEESPADIWWWEMQHYRLFNVFYLVYKMDQPGYIEVRHGNS
jgi:hypothetical protein